MKFIVFDRLHVEFGLERSERFELRQRRDHVAVAHTAHRHGSAAAAGHRAVLLLAFLRGLVLRLECLENLFEPPNREVHRPANAARIGLLQVRIEGGVRVGVECVLPTQFGFLRGLLDRVGGVLHDALEHQQLGELALRHRANLDRERPLPIFEIFVTLQEWPRPLLVGEYLLLNPVGLDHGGFLPFE